MQKKLKKLSEYLANLRLLSFFHEEYTNDLKNPKILMGNVLANQNIQKEVRSIHDVEFKVFSQWGDDGIIQYLLAKVDFPNKTFIEFGVETYRESNTRYLLINNKWHGMVIDGSPSHIDYIKKDVISWAHHLYAECAFIKKDNINELLNRFVNRGYSPEIGILSIDIDGNDYWIWKEIVAVKPVLVIAEYNAVFGDTNKWTIPYSDDFNRFSMLPKGYLYYGSSLEAYKQLAEEKGYRFIGCNSNGNNCYFLRKDKMAGLEHLAASARFVDSSFQELWLTGAHTEYYGKKRLDFIKGEKVFDLNSNSVIDIK
jgi:hypothetical protein